MSDPARSSAAGDGVRAEGHAISRIGWLRAAVLGANDGIVSTGSLVIGIVESGASKPAILVAGLAALVAGAMSMAAGEFVSVSSQSDTEKADLAREVAELAAQPAFERQELADVYVRRGLEPGLALEVADQLMARDALGAHARDELGISEVSTARPLQAALASAAAFSAGAALPLLVIPFASRAWLVPAIAIVSLLCLAILGYLGARAGDAPVRPSVSRILFWGALAMLFTALVGRIFGASIT